MQTAERSYHPPKRRRPRRGIASVLAWTLAAAGLAIGATTATAEPAIAAPRLDCSEIYGLEGEAPNRIWKLDPNTGTQTVAASFEVSGTLNALGITADGSMAFAALVSGTSANIYVYDLEAGTSSLLGSVSSVTATSHGAVDPSGIFYFGGFSGGILQIFGFDPKTRQSLGLVASGAIPNTGGAGDWVFDRNGALYVLGGTNGSSVISVITQQLPTTSGNRISLTGTELTRATTPASEQLSGAAFGSDGYLYVSSGSSITRIHPTTGANLGTTQLGSSGMVDMASCVTPNTVEVQADFAEGRVQPADQVELSVTGDGIGLGNTATTAGDASGVQNQIAGPVLVLPGASVTVSETGSGADERNYAVSWSCVDRNSSRLLGAGTGTTGSFTVPTTSTEGVAAVCTFTNRAYKPAIVLSKSADRAALVAGETVTYSFVAKNTGNVTLTEVEVREVAFSGSAAVSAVTCPERSLAPGASVTCAATYVVPQADVDRGSVANTAVVTGVPPVGDAVESTPSTVTLTASSKPAITVKKTANRTTLVAGETVTYSFELTNTGNLSLSAAGVREGAFTGTGALSSVSCPAGAANLSPKASVKCSASYVVTQADVDRGSVSNTATAVGFLRSGDPVVSTPSTLSLTAAPKPAIVLSKSADRAALVAGETVTYSFVAKNTGNVTLTEVEVREVAFSGSAAVSAVTCPERSLAPGASVTCAATYVVPQADVDRGSVANTAVAAATPPSGDPVDSPPSSVTLRSSSKPAIALKKTANRAGLVAGDTVTYSFELRNTGNVTLSSVSVHEEKFSGAGELSTVSCPAGAGTLTPGASVTCSASYAVSQADVDKGSVTNTATATGTPPTGAAIASQPSSVTLAVTTQPGIALTKTADRAELVVGETVSYSFSMTNIGNVTLKDVKPREGAFSGAGPLSAVSCPASAKSLAPAASASCTATYVVTQADVDRGSLDNTATATGNPPSGTPVVSEPSTATVTVAQQPAIGLTGTVTPESGSHAGEDVVYSLTVRNTGNVTLTDVALNRRAFSGTGELGAITCARGFDSLAPGKAVGCTIEYRLTQPDVDSGALSYTADATGTTPAGADIVSSSPVTLDLPIRHEPGLTLVKSADKEGLIVDDVVTFSYVVTNTGNVTLAPVTLTLVDFTGAATPSEIVCPGETALAPGAQMICTATYVVQQDDVDAGQLLSTATATGAPPIDEPVVTPLAEAQLVQEAAPSLTLAKTADVEKVDSVGDVVTYSFLVTNTGNVTVSAIAIDEGAFSGEGTISAVECPADVSSLIPGQRMTCTATYAATRADFGAVTVTNTATAKGAAAGGAREVVSEPSTAEVKTVPLPTATLASTGSNIASGALLALGILLGLGGLCVIVSRWRLKRSA